MEEVSLIAGGIPAVENKKRSRAKPKPLGGASLTVLDQRFVCNFTGRVVPKAIFFPGVHNVCFCNIPCAFAWLEDCSGADDITIAKHKQGICEEYEQTMDVIARAPKRDALSDFGGDMTYDAWIAPLREWDMLTDVKGTTVAEFRSADKNKGKSATKKGKGASAKISFDAAMYVVGHQGGAAKCKKVTAVDGADVKDGLSPVRAFRKINTFVTAHNGDVLPKKYVVDHIHTEAFNATYIVTADATAGDEKLLNKVASQVLALQVYGPAVISFLRKHSQKV